MNVRIHQFRADRFKEARQACQLTQKQLAEEIGVATSAVEDWERGRRCPHVRNFMEAVRRLNVRPEYLMDMDDQP